MEYYSKNAKKYIEETKDCDMTTQYKMFESNLEGKEILDIGFGSGRDMLYFKQKGYHVEGIDPTLEFCTHAEDSGLQVFNIPVEDITFKDRYDGIWACASLLHCKDLNLVMNKLYTSLKDKGILYASFKFGNFEGEEKGRYFHYLDNEGLSELIKNSPFKLVCKSISYDVRDSRKDERWLNFILKKDNKELLN